MPYKHTWTPDGLYLEAYGVVTLKDVVEAQAKFYGDSRSETVKYVLWNSLGAEKIDMRDTEYLFPAGNDLGASMSVRNLRVALVAVDPVMKELCVQYQLLLLKHSVGWVVEIFEQLEEAEAWAMT